VRPAVVAVWACRQLDFSLLQLRFAYMEINHIS
jgi:hypothetical protein